MTLPRHGDASNTEVGASVPLRVLMVHHGTACGGAEVHILTLARELAVSGHGVALAVPRRSWLAHRAGNCGIEVHSLAIRERPLAWSRRRLMQIARAVRPCLMHSHVHRAERVAISVARRLGLPLIHTVHAAHGSELEHCSHADEVIAVSHKGARRLIESGWGRPIRVIPNGVVDPTIAREPHHQSARSASNSREESFTVGMLGRFMPVKGHELLLDALETIPVQPSWRIMLAGNASTRWGRWVVTLARTSRWREQISFCGFQRQPARFLTALDVLVQPSRSEAMPLSVLEAMAVGCPVVATNVGGIGEVIESGVSGVLTAANDPMSIAAALSMLAGNSAMRISLAARARETYEKEFTADHMVQRTVELYRRVVSRTHVSRMA